jgi:undecaprenyl-phosphate galactose phosphotransferase
MKFLPGDTIATKRPNALFLGDRRSSEYQVREKFALVIRFASLVSADVLAMCLAGLTAAELLSTARATGLVLDYPLSEIDQFTAALPEFGLIGLWIFIQFLLKGHYSARIPFWTETKQLVQSTGYALLGIGFLEFAFRTSNSRLLLVATWIFFAIYSILLRYVAKLILTRKGLWQLNILMVGNRDGIANASAALASDPQLGYRVVGEITMDQLPRSHAQGSFRSLMHAHRASRLMLALDVGSVDGRRLVKAVVRQGVPFSLVPEFEGLPVFGYDQVAFLGHDTMMLSYRSNVDRPVSRTMKMVFDVVVATLLLMILALPMLLIACCIRLDGGHVLFAQSRVGLGGRTFPCFKFRTMVTNAHAVLRELLDRDPVARGEWTEAHKLTRDPRITPIGRFLRATSLDELPQLFNVLRLEMSLVGPRPIVPEEIKRYEEDISFYFEIKPGLTGLWQVSGRSTTSYARRVQLDSWYVRNWSVWHDLAILLKTIPAVLKRRGAV